MSVEISADLVKEVRRRTGIGIGKCKEALSEAKGDVEKAIDYLRKSGMASAVKKASRETKEGIVAAAESDSRVAMVEINAETDFVVANQIFQDFAMDIVHEVLQKAPASVEEFLTESFSKNPEQTIDQARMSVVQSLGENIRINRILFFDKDASSSFGFYSHAGGKIVTLVEISGDAGEQSLARDIAMHATAESPQYLSSEEIPQEVIEREKEIAGAQMQGKPAHILEKILEGKLRAFYNQVCLLPQKFIKDPDLSITQVVEKRAKESGKPLSVKRFVRWQVGVG